MLGTSRIPGRKKIEMPWRASRFAARIATVMTTISGASQTAQQSHRSSVPQRAAVDARTG